jgi:NAD(P)-dependent dehydrogenase (short-subunit alcohol dehydrogenase family)
VSLIDQRVLVLGGASGIGLAAAQTTAKAGAEVIVVSSTVRRVEAAVAALPDGVTGHVVDLTDEGAIRS